MSKQDLRDRQLGPRKPSARGQQPQRSDLSSGGGQVRQSNRSGLSGKLRGEDSSRQGKGEANDSSQSGTSGQQPADRREGTPVPAGNGERQRRASQARRGRNR